MAVFAALREDEFHYGGGAQLIDDYVGGVRDVGLGAVYVQQRYAAAGQDALYNGHLFCAAADAFGAGKGGQRLFCDVILGWTKPSGNHHYIILFQEIVQMRKDSGAVVSDRGYTADPHADRVQGAGDVRRVGVHNLANENLVADGADGCLFHFRFLLFFLRYLMILLANPGPL